MKLIQLNLLAFLAVISSSAFAFGPTDGFLNTKTKQRLWVDFAPGRNDAMTFYLSEATTPNEGKVISKNLLLPAGSAIDPYQTRYGTYQQIMTTAQLQLPSFPEIVLMIHLQRSTKIYLKGFEAIEQQKGLVDCPALYFEKYLQAIVSPAI